MKRWACSLNPSPRTKPRLIDITTVPQVVDDDEKAMRVLRQRHNIDHQEVM
jgi:hypothetical protein